MNAELDPDHDFNYAHIFNCINNCHVMGEQNLNFRKLRHEFRNQKAAWSDSVAAAGTIARISHRKVLIVTLIYFLRRFNIRGGGGGN